MVRLTLIGHLGNAPEPRETRDGDTFAVSSVAINQGYWDSKSREWVEQDSIWISLVGFGYIADKMLKMDKGQMVYIEGVPSAKSYQNKSGETVDQLSCNVKAIRSFNPKSNENGSRRRRNRRQNQYEEDDYGNPL